MDDRKIFRFQQLRRVDTLDDPAAELLHAHRARGGRVFAQRAVDRRRGRAVGGGEQRVARAEGQSVRTANDRACDDLYRVTVATDHLADHGDLLEILLSEVGSLGPDDVEQPADDLGHSVEMTRAVGSLHRFVRRTQIEHTGVLLRIDVFDRRHQDIVYPGFLEQRQVGFLGAGIILQVVRVVELRRVDEDADDRAIALRAAFLHQRKMPLVQGSHRRDEACPPGSASHFARQFRVFRKDFHRVLSYAFGVFFDMAKVEIRL